MVGLFGSSGMEFNLLSAFLLNPSFMVEDLGANSIKSLTRSGPKIPAVGPFGGGFLFGLDKFGHLMVNMPHLGNLVIGFLMATMTYLLNFRSLGPLHGLEEAPVVH